MEKYEQKNSKWISVSKTFKKGYQKSKLYLLGLEYENTKNGITCEFMWLWFGSRNMSARALSRALELGHWVSNIALTRLAMAWDGIWRLSIANCYAIVINKNAKTLMKMNLF